MSRVNISNISNGALVEQADVEIQKVLQNIADPNTDPTKKRKVNITLIFEGDSDREIADVTFEVKSILVPSRKQTTRVAFERNGSNMVAEELIRGTLKGQARIDNETGEIVEPATSNKMSRVK